MGARNAIAVTPHDTNPLVPIPDALLIGGAGNVVLRARGDSTDVTIAVVAGQYLLIEAQYVRTTTTATGIVALTE